jgi:hypothetical protein
MEEAVLPAVFALGSAVLLAAGVRVMGLPPRRIGAALGRVVEWAGLATLVALANLALGFLLVLALRRLTGRFVTLYVNTDVTLLAVSALQAAALQWWMEERGGD